MTKISNGFNGRGKKTSMKYRLLSLRRWMPHQLRVVCPKCMIVGRYNTLFRLDPDVIHSRVERIGVGGTRLARCA